MKFQKGQTPKNKLTHEQWYSKNKDKLEKRDITLLTKYIKSSERIEVKFNKCGYVTKMLPGNLIKGYGCKYCSGNQKISKKEFKKMFEIADVYKEYSLRSEYLGMNHKINVQHSCGHEYKVTASKFIHGNKRCPKCNESKGEKHLYEFLKNNNFDFERQYTNEECRLKNKLPFDFAVFENNNILFLIEYQGEQHYRERPFLVEKKDLNIKRKEIVLKENFVSKIIFL